MIHPLDGVEAKLARADAHFGDIEGAIEGFIDHESDRIPGEFDPDLPGYVFRAQRDSRGLDELGPVIGDYVHNLRAALDYLVWGLTSPAVQQGKKATKVEFPIFPDRAHWISGRGSDKIQGILDPAARTAIECLQPFNRPDCRPNLSLGPHPRDTPLWRLYELDNWDKHRQLHLALHVLGGEWEGFDQLGILMPKGSVLPGSHERGAVVARITFPLARPNVNVYFVAASDVRFDTHGPECVWAVPVLKTLADIRTEIRDRVVPRLTPFFCAR